MDTRNNANAVSLNTQSSALWNVQWKAENNFGAIVHKYTDNQIKWFYFKQYWHNLALPW